MRRLGQGINRYGMPVTPDYDQTEEYRLMCLSHLNQLRSYLTTLARKLMDESADFRDYEPLADDVRNHMQEILPMLHAYTLTKEGKDVTTNRASETRLGRNRTKND